MTHSEQFKGGSLAIFFYQLAEGARRQSNVIFALIYRDLKSRSSDDYGFLSLIGIMLEPAIAVIGLASFWYLMRRTEIDGVHVLLFLAVSVTPFTMVRRSLATIPRTVRSAKAFYAFPNVKPFDAVAARFIVEFTLTLLGAGILFFMMWWFLDLSMNSTALLEVISVLALLTMASFGLSLFLGIYANRYTMISSIISMSSRLLLLVSAVMHPAATLPTSAQAILAYNPLAHAMELLRFYALGMKPFHGVSLEFFAMFSLTCLSVGFIAYFANRKSILENK
jgi:capsular polysaccharide transport system permease protein